MIFFYKIQSADVIESLPNTDHVQKCETLLRKRKECEDFDFFLQGSFNSLEDLVLSSGNYSENQPSSWNSFFDTMFPAWNKFASITRKCYTIFKIVCDLVHNGQKKTPLHLSLWECVHDTCESKKLIQIINRLRLCMSYDELERIDTGLNTRTIQLAGNNRVTMSKYHQVQLPSNTKLKF